MRRILIVDDDIAVTNYFRVSLAQTEEFESAVVNDARHVADLLARERFDVILLDMDMPEVSGADILKLMRENDIRTPVVVLTGVGDVDLAVKAMKLGAFDYLTKPVDDEYLLGILRQAVEFSAVHQSLNELPPQPKREDLAHRAAFEGFITQHPKMIRLLHEAEKMAAGDMTVLIIGERGTVREPLARAMHQVSRRRAGPLVAADVSAESPEVLPSVLFGQARSWGGAAEEREGLLEEAAGGTLFVDHIEHLGIPAQLRLKRVIQTGEYYRDNTTHVLTANVRLIVASTQDLASPEYKGSFSKDLLYHLMVNVLRIPPLRARREDIPLLAEHVMRREAGRAGKAACRLAPDVVGFLGRYPFPGNDRELEAMIASTVLRCESEQIALSDLPPYALEAGEGAGPTAAGVFEPRKLAEVEKDYVVHMLKYCGGDKKRAAAELGISVRQMDGIVANGQGPAPRGRTREKGSK